MTSPPTSGPPDSSATGERCELCEAVTITEWYHDDALCWVADCEACEVPMVVWRQHGDTPPTDQQEQMLARLRAVAADKWGAEGFYLDEVMRQIPDHFHAHARRAWWT